jgi:hypothetical protein
VRVRLTAKKWIEKRIEELTESFAVGVGGFSVMDNHLHLLVRLDPGVAQGWSDEEVVRRWGQLCPPRDKSRHPLPVTEEWVQRRLKDLQWVATTRGRLQSVSWYMKFLFERLGCSSRSWQVRIERLREGRLLGRFFASSRAKLREIAERLGVRRLANLAGCPAR